MTSKTHTAVDPAALRGAIRMWLRTKIFELHKLAGETEDLYLKLVSIATELTYEEVFTRYKNGDEGINAARRLVKRDIFARLLVAPTSILTIHDEVVVVRNPTVESVHGAQKLEDLADQPLHTPTRPGTNRR